MLLLRQNFQSTRGDTVLVYAKTKLTIAFFFILLGNISKRVVAMCAVAYYLTWGAMKWNGLSKLRERSKKHTKSRKARPNYQKMAFFPGHADKCCPLEAGALCDTYTTAAQRPFVKLFFYNFLWTYRIFFWIRQDILHSWGRSWIFQKFQRWIQVRGNEATQHGYCCLVQIGMSSEEESISLFAKLF